ncbi:hypothetical protein AK812_SmicGene37395 [Symbiodinium microadriaticum]|uniref:Uncharacterized protein n=1 Tax=Symbiodinium microadriaticum TaxID=2951 RepID=A0A1Q9CGF1_SYMMI|nr:hypothetical protein AK812_SmicGene37395 [Symbiodinium microadriaticum]
MLWRPEITDRPERNRSKKMLLECDLVFAKANIAPAAQAACKMWVRPAGAPILWELIAEMAAAAGLGTEVPRPQPKRPLGQRIGGSENVLRIDAKSPSKWPSCKLLATSNNKENENDQVARKAHEVRPNPIPSHLVFVIDIVITIITTIIIIVIIMIIIIITVITITIIIIVIIMIIIIITVITITIIIIIIIIIIITIIIITTSTTIVIFFIIFIINVLSISTSSLRTKFYVAICIPVLGSIVLSEYGTSAISLRSSSPELLLSIFGGRKSTSVVGLSTSQMNVQLFAALQHTEK